MSSARTERLVVPTSTRHSVQARALHAGGRTILYLVIAAGAIIFSFPFLWMISTALKPADQMLAMPPVWIPRALVFDNYIRPFQNLPFDVFFRNSAVITILGVFGAVASSSLVAFGFARLRWPGRDIFFVVMLATLMLPSPVTMIPRYYIFAKTGLINTFIPLILPDYLGSPFLIFLLRQYMLTIPLEYDDAARIDGCGWFGIFWRILVPMSFPALGVAAIYSFTFHWNDFINPIIYLTRVELFTVPLGLALMNSRYATDFGGMMAVASISLIPVLIVFFSAQRYFIQGLVISGVKG
jgi:ABC-type glycerol-3-phosphate transport system permease component